MKLQPVTYITRHLANSKDNSATAYFALQLSSLRTHTHTPPLLDLPLCTNAHTKHFQ